MADALFYCSLLQIRSFYLGYPTATANADSIANGFSKMSACPFSALNITVIFICLFSRKRGNGKRSLLRRLCCQKRNLELLRIYNWLQQEKLIFPLQTKIVYGQTVYFNGYCIYPKQKTAHLQVRRFYIYFILIVQNKTGTNTSRILSF